MTFWISKQKKFQNDGNFTGDFSSKMKRFQIMPKKKNLKIPSCFDSLTQKLWCALYLCSTSLPSAPLSVPLPFFRTSFACILFKFLKNSEILYPNTT